MTTSPIPFGEVGCDRWIYMSHRFGVETGAEPAADGDPGEWYIPVVGPPDTNP